MSIKFFIVHLLLIYTALIVLFLALEQMSVFV